MVNLFIILPESAPSIQWAESNDDFQDEEKIIEFIEQLRSKLHTLHLENYDGYYDNLNIQNFLRDFNDMEEYYPNPAFRLLRRSLADWNNWREAPQQVNNKSYSIYSQSITDHLFCEVAERQLLNENQKFALLNHHGHRLGNLIAIAVNGRMTSLASLASIRDITHWFAQERMPPRNFQVTVKHGKNRQDERIINGELISPLRCSASEALEMLHFAIGDDTKELYNYDQEQEYFIVFKFEGNTPQNMYHGYHLPEDTLEIPENIKHKLRTRSEQL